MKPRLNEQWVGRIFQRLSGIYGNQFKAKFSQVEDGVDIGMAMATVAWSAELGGFDGNADAIAWALDHLPSDHCPNALEFRDICRRCPPKEVPALPHHLSPEEIARNKARIAEIAAGLFKAKGMP